MQSLLEPLFESRPLALLGAGRPDLTAATEEVLGQVADSSSAEMQRAIGAARRAFDESDWSTNRALRRRCLEQLHEALVGEALCR